jgi:hypothetical protein
MGDPFVGNLLLQTIICDYWPVEFVAGVEFVEGAGDAGELGF